MWILQEREEWWEAGRNCLLGRYSTKPVVVRGAAGWWNRVTGLGYSEWAGEVVLVVT